MIDTKALRAAGPAAASDMSEEAASEIDRLRVELAAARAPAVEVAARLGLLSEDGAMRLRLCAEIARLEGQQKNHASELVTARALAFAEVAAWCGRHAGDATLDRTGVERKTLLRLEKRLPELAPLPASLRALSVEVLRDGLAVLEEDHGPKDVEPECGLCRVRAAFAEALKEPAR